MDTCSAVMLSGHKPHGADAVIEAGKNIKSHVDNNTFAKMRELDGASVVEL
jgi:hypothetical protein